MLSADAAYKTTNFYSPKHEKCIRWDDPTLSINWPLDGIQPVVSDKDALGMSFEESSL
ncbi:MAG: dTDP-4-keto-6-deoxy-D-glucose epimerase [Chthoniobacterales bacterium]|nr:dTDP-4-keto-6-deoxy-D-glucose epimerase [Chthoniobacterales bacterium]